MLVYGINPVLHALRSGRATVLRVASRADPRVARLLEDARRRGVPIEHVDRASLDRATRSGVHQGVAADVAGSREYSVDELVALAAPEPALLVVLDGLEDPQNVGAIIRTADAAGAHGLIRQARRAAALDGAVAKASAGAVAHVRIATVVNIARALDELKAAGVWTVGLSADGPEQYDRIDLTLPTALVLGAEGAGLRRLVKERCDRLAAIPLRGAVASLNVSVAAGVTLFEAVRQRRASGTPDPASTR